MLPEDGKFSIGMEFGSRESVVSAIKSYTISRGVDYTVYESEPQTFYAKYKGYGVGCDWLIRANLIRKKGNIVVNRFDRCNEMFKDESCRHVLACCANQHFDWQVYVQDVYKISEICKVYRGKFVSMGDPSTWARYEGAKVIANWTLRRTTKGRPKSTRYLNEMDLRDMRDPCQSTICGREIYSRIRCPQHTDPSSARSQ
ncbi:hypothetical protein Ahy_B03g063664 [Arachis hypogaea]|uniref:Uncharacterized protein n=1 Tax=Arachis hypogaea TaxID=3818 RepID=A0A444ZYA2_ARAHY|nr:hypothetical protein Ahy_B03g063664 [Arachis hypogaea]